MSANFPSPLALGFGPSISKWCIRMVLGWWSCFGGMRNFWSSFYFFALKYAQSTYLPFEYGPIDSDIPPYPLKRSGTLILNWHKGWLTILPVTFWDETESRLFGGLLRIRSFLLNLQLFELLHLFHSLSSDGIIGVDLSSEVEISFSLSFVAFISSSEKKYLADA